MAVEGSGVEAERDSESSPHLSPTRVTDISMDTLMAGIGMETPILMCY